jgi:uncharacterized protein
MALETGVGQALKHLFIGSIEAHSGKSSILLGLAHQFRKQGLTIGYGKPLTTSSDAPSDHSEGDVAFLATTLKLKPEQLLASLVQVDDGTIAARISQADRADYPIQLAEQFSQDLSTPGILAEADVLLLEGPSSLVEGYLFDLALPRMAEVLDASVVLVVRCSQRVPIDGILVAQSQLGDRLVGVILNDISAPVMTSAKASAVPFLEGRGIAVLGLMPHSDLLRSVSVAEIVRRLNAEVLCSAERLDLMVESLCIGAMNVNSALEYFRKGHNMAVITGGDRADLQLAALETSTQCLILTGRMAPTATILNRAEEMEIPILSVDLDTLTTVELIEQAFSEVSFHEQVKAQCVFQLSDDHIDLPRLLSLIGLEN